MTLTCSLLKHLPCLQVVLNLAVVAMVILHTFAEKKFCDLCMWFLAP